MKKAMTCWSYGIRKMAACEETRQFVRDMKRLLKKLPSLREDFEVFKKNLNSYGSGIPALKKAGNNDKVTFYKARRFACKSLPGKGGQSGIRVIFAHCPGKQKTVFLEIYFKPRKEKEDRRRISAFVKNCKSAGI